MALQNHPALCTGGAERFQYPSANLYAQMLARKQARQEALDQYYQNLHKNINPAGMRTQDITGGFSQKVQGWEKHFMENKQRIQNPKNPEDRNTAIENQSMYQDLLMDIQKSKEPAAHEMEYAKFILSGKGNPTENDMKVAHALSASIYSREHYKDDAMTQPYTINDFDLNVPQFDPKQQEEFYKAATQGLTAGKTYDEKSIRRDKTSGQVFIPYEQSYSSEQLKTIADKAGSLVEGSRSAKVHYENLLHDKNFFDAANKAYQSVYGAKEVVDTPKKAAQAATIIAAQNERNKGEELRKDETLDFQRQQFMEGLRQKNRLDLLKEREKAKSLGQAADDVWIDNYIDSLEDDANEGGKDKLKFTQKGGRPVIAPIIEVDPVLAKALEKQKLQPAEVMVLPDGMYKPVYYKYDEKGQRIPTKSGGYEVDNELSTPISRQQLKLALGGKSVSATQRTREMLNQPKTEQKYESITTGTYNGKKVQIGMKNGKWYNIETGEEIK